MNLPKNPFLYSIYFAPRGKTRLMELGNLISTRHLLLSDRLVGIMGVPGAGKSLLVRGMFPGLEVTNDDEDVYVRPLPIIDHYQEGRFKNHTYHIDVRFEMAFTQLYVLADAVLAAVNAGRRVVIEHYDLLYSFLGRNADLLVGIGGEVVVTRPTIFGPLPADITAMCFESINFRHQVHTAEDCTSLVLETQYNLSLDSYSHSDVRHGFVLEFDTPPEISIPELNGRVQAFLQAGQDVAYVDEDHIKLGDYMIRCTGPRIHVSNTKEIKFFQLVDDFLYDPVSGRYNLVGIVDQKLMENVSDLNKFDW